MVRALLLLAAALTAQSAFAILGIETDPDKIEAGWQKEKIEALAKDRDPKERAAAAKWLGGRKEPEVIAALAAALSDREARVREAAANALWDSGKAAEPARPQLFKALEDTDPNVVTRAAGALSAIGVKPEELLPARKRVFDSPDATMESRFLVSRSLVGREPAVRILEPTLAFLEKSAAAKGNFTRHNIELAEEALKRLVKTQDRTLIPPLMDAARNVKAGQPIILGALSSFSPPPDGYASFVVTFLESPDSKVRYAALGAMRSLTKDKDVALWAPHAAAMLRDSDSSVRSEALWALGSAAGLAAGEIDKVVAALGDPEKSVRRSAARAIGEIGDKSQPVAAAAKARVAEASRPALTAAMEKDNDADVRDEAKRSLAKLGTGSGGAAVVTAATGAVTASAASESGGMALLRSRKVTFEESSFFRALSEVDVELVRAFLDAGMSPKEPVAGMGPPLRAMLFGSAACSPQERPTKAQAKALVKLLLDRGADPNGADKNGNTALMEASSHGCDRELMRLLIKSGGKVNATNAAGLTPFEMGLVWGHDGLEELIAAGYRLPPEKAKMYEQGYAGRAAALAMIKKAVRK